MHGVALAPDPPPAEWLLRVEDGWPEVVRRGRPSLGDWQDSCDAAMRTALRLAIGLGAEEGAALGTVLEMVRGYRRPDGEVSQGCVLGVAIRLAREGLGHREMSRGFAHRELAVGFEMNVPSSLMSSADCSVQPGSAIRLLRLTIPPDGVQRKARCRLSSLLWCGRFRPVC